MKQTEEQKAKAKIKRDLKKAEQIENKKKEMEEYFASRWPDLYDRPGERPNPLDRIIKK